MGGCRECRTVSEMTVGLHPCPLAGQACRDTCRRRPLSLPGRAGWTRTRWGRLPHTLAGLMGDLEGAVVSSTVVAGVAGTGDL